ncbi:MAG: hypothetical protein ACRC2U_11790, partial [Aeromonas sp.]
MKLLTLSLVTAAVFGLAACGQKEQPAAPAPAPSAAAPAPAPAAPPAPAANTEEKVLNVYNWPDYVP